MLHSLALNHPFNDGNKRVPAAAAVIFAEMNGFSFLADEDELGDMTLAVAEGHVDVEALNIWLRQRLRAAE